MKFTFNSNILLSSFTSKALGGWPNQTSPNHNLSSHSMKLRPTTTTTSQTIGTPPSDQKTLIKFHSLFEHEGADQGMADLLTMAGWQDVSYELADVIIFNGGADIGTQIYGQ